SPAAASSYRAPRRLRRAFDKDAGQRIGHIEHDVMAAGDLEILPSLVAAHALGELAERPARMARGADIGEMRNFLPGAAQPGFLRHGADRLIDRAAIDPRDIAGIGDAEVTRGERVDAPAFAAELRLGALTLGDLRRLKIEHRFAVAWDEGIEKDEGADALRQAVGGAGHDHAAIGMPDEHDFIELVMLDRAHHIGDMRLEVDLGSGEMRALAKPGERRNFDPMAMGAQPLGDALPDPAALPCA